MVKKGAQVALPRSAPPYGPRSARGGICARLAWVVLGVFVAIFIVRAPTQQHL